MDWAQWVRLIAPALLLTLLPCWLDSAHSSGLVPPQCKVQVTTLLPPKATQPNLFLELYRGAEPGEWTATAGSSGKTQRKLSLELPNEAGPWLLRVDSRPAGKGNYSIALHCVGKAPPARFDAASADRYEGDDSWFQASPISLGEVQAHSMGPSSNPRGDEDWFLLRLEGELLAPAGAP